MHRDPNGCVVCLRARVSELQLDKDLFTGAVGAAAGDLKAMVALKKHLDSGRGINMWPATKGIVVEIEGADGDVVGEDLAGTILKALAELEEE